MLKVIVSQGRIGDRTARTLEGAALTAQALRDRYHYNSAVVGIKAAPAQDNWTESLVAARETLLGLRMAVEKSIDDDYLTIMVANTCSASLATLPVVARKHPDAVILWVDAHGDFNTPATTGTGYLGGMVLSAVCGLWDSGHGAGLLPTQAIMLGARDIDAAEADLLRESGVRLIPPANATPTTVLDALNGAPVWIHIDWDAMEPGFIPADYQVPGGFFPEQLKAILQAIPASQVLGLEIAEFYPSDDQAQNHQALITILEIISPILDARIDAKRTE